MTDAINPINIGDDHSTSSFLNAIVASKSILSKLKPIENDSITIKDKATELLRQTVDGKSHLLKKNPDESQVEDDVKNEEWDEPPIERVTDHVRVKAVEKPVENTQKNIQMDIQIDNVANEQSKIKENKAEDALAVRKILAQVIGERRAAITGNDKNNDDDWDDEEKVTQTTMPVKNKESKLTQSTTEVVSAPVESKTLEQKIIEPQRRAFFLPKLAAVNRVQPVVSQPVGEKSEAPVATEAIPKVTTQQRSTFFARPLPPTPTSKVVKPTAVQKATGVPTVAKPVAVAVQKAADVKTGGSVNALIHYWEGIKKQGKDRIAAHRHMPQRLR